YMVVEIATSLRDSQENSKKPELEAFIRDHMIEQIMRKNEINFNHVNTGEMVHETVHMPYNLIGFFDGITHYFIPLIIMTLIITGINIGLFAIMTIMTVFLYRQNELSTIETTGLIMTNIVLLEHMRNLSRNAFETMVYSGNLQEGNDYLQRLHDDIIPNGTER